MNFYAVSPHSEVVTFLNNFGAPISSCGRRMRPLASGSGGGSPEVHVPILSINGNEVTVHVGTQPHPMLSVHYIQWIVLECANSRQCRFLVPGQEPKATFLLTDGDQVEAAIYTDSGPLSGRMDGHLPFLRFSLPFPGGYATIVVPEPCPATDASPSRDCP